MRLGRWQRVVGGVALALILAYLWFFVQAPAGSGDFRIDLSELRREAHSVPGERPQRIRVERVAKFGFPGAVVRTGDGWGMRPMEVFSFQLVSPGQTTIIDTGITSALPGGSLDAESLGRVGKALSKADLIVVTHEHVDHLGGLVAQPNVRELLKVTKLNTEQVSHPELLDPAKFPPGALDGYRPISYPRILAVAPGVVLLRAPGHTPGSQMVYVQLADGTEFLFLGDVAWSARNVESVGGRPRAIALMMHEDRGAVMRQLEALHALAESAPSLHLVPGHDPHVVDALVGQHLLEEKFQL